MSFNKVGPLLNRAGYPIMQIDGDYFDVHMKGRLKGEDAVRAAVAMRDWLNAALKTSEDSP